MNINTEKQNLFSLSGEGEAYSPYLSPLLANNNSKEFDGEEELLNFNLDEAEEQQEHSLIKEEEVDLNLDLLMDHKSTPEPELMEDSPVMQVVDRKPVCVMGSKKSTQIQSIINFLVDNDQLSENQIKQAGRQLYQDSPTHEYIFTVMLAKLKKLRKTKEEMTKFCMRKAFKFASDEQSLTRKKRKSSKQEHESDSLGFEMPFRKNSTQKTMNAQFLKQVFSKEAFVHIYERFLEQFRSIILEDNQYKIKYLSDTIESYTKSQNSLKVPMHKMQKIQQIKRLPWTKSILTKTQNLAFSLLKFVDQKDEREPPSKE